MFMSIYRIWQVLRENRREILEQKLAEDPGLVSAVDDTGSGPLHIATKYNSAALAQVLLDHKAGKSSLNSATIKRIKFKINSSSVIFVEIK